MLLLLYNANVYTHVRNWVTMDNVITWAKTQETDLSWKRSSDLAQSRVMSAVTAVAYRQKHKTHVTFNFWPIILIFSTLVKIHVYAKCHQAKFRGSRVTAFTDKKSTAEKYCCRYHRQLQLHIVALNAK